MDFEMKSPAELDEMTYDELLAESLAAGREVDALREYRRDLKARYSLKQQVQDVSAKFGAELTEEQVQKINAIVNAPRLSINTEVQK